MAGEIITTTLTSSYAVQDGDELYIARTGQIIMNTGSNYAIYAIAATPNVSVIVDGSVIATSGSLSNPRAISLSAGGEGIYSNLIVSVGTEGIVRSFYASAIRLIGDNARVSNQGLAQGYWSGVTLRGDHTFLTNSGTIDGHESWAEITGLNTSVVNTGRISAIHDALTMGCNAAALANSGQIDGGRTGFALYGVSAGQVIDAQITNSGTISGSETGILDAGSSLGAGSELLLANSGTIQGGTGIHTRVNLELAVTNALGGVIQASAGPAIHALDVLRLTNFGSITSTTTAAIVLGADSGFTSITNYGQIGGWAGSFDGTALLTGGGAFLTNYGTILGGYTGAAVGDFIRNFATMEGISSVAGNDSIRNAGLVNGFVLLGAGNDTYRGAGGWVEGWVDGGTDNDTLLGGALEDDLRGGNGDDLIEGRIGDDLLQGDAGLDNLAGGAGNDTLNGGSGADVLVGGTGTDRFIFTSAADIGLGVNRDRIGDFNNGNDVIDLSPFMAGASYIAGAAFAVTALGQVRYVAATGILSGDVDGNGVADWDMLLVGKPALTAADFLF